MIVLKDDSLQPYNVILFVLVQLKMGEVFFE